MPEWTSDAIAGAAILVAVWTFYRQQRLNQRMAGIEEERRAEEVTARLRADVTAFFEPRVTTQGKLRKSFVIHNRGPSAARNVAFEISPGAGGGEAPLMVGLDDHEFPLPYLDAGGRYGMAVEFVLGSATSVNVALKWQDESGPGEKSLQLSTIG